eukprot:524514-Rhodomonas_salina.1
MQGCERTAWDAEMLHTLGCGEASSTWVLCSDEVSFETACSSIVACACPRTPLSCPGHHHAVFVLCHAPVAICCAMQRVRTSSLALSCVIFRSCSASSRDASWPGLAA